MVWAPWPGKTNARLMPPPRFPAPLAGRPPGRKPGSGGLSDRHAHRELAGRHGGELHPRLDPLGGALEITAEPGMKNSEVAFGPIRDMHRRSDPLQPQEKLSRTAVAAAHEHALDAFEGQPAHDPRESPAIAPRETEFTLRRVHLHFVSEATVGHEVDNRAGGSEAR